MKNKNLKIFIIVVLLVQIILPAGLLGYHYSLYNYALNNTPDFKLQVSWLDLHSYGENGEILYNNHGNSEEVLYIDIADTYYNKDTAVTTGPDGFAVLTEVQNKKLNKYWFSYENYCKLGSFSKEEGEFEYVDTPEAQKIISEWIGYYQYYEWDGIDYKGGNTVYITAKVYKGIFIPIAVYKDDVKIIELTIKK